MSEVMEAAVESTQSSEGINNLTDVAGDPNEGTEAVNTETHPNDQVAVEEDGTWFLSDGVAGTGDKPDWFNGEKYKNVAEQAKGYKELQKKLGAFTGSPETYTDDLGSEYEGIEFDQDDELLVGVKELAKESNMSQEGYQNLLKKFVDYTVKQNEVQQELIKESALAELEKIGPNPSSQINEMVGWFGQNFPASDIDSFKNIIRTASDFKVLNTMRDAMGYKKINSSSTSSPLPDHQELIERLNSQKYQDNPLERKEVDRLYGVLISNGGIKS